MSTYSLLDKEAKTEAQLKPGSKVTSYSEQMQTIKDYAIYLLCCECHQSKYLFI
jgi:hypothetical protein